jgi:Predicted membrane protein (DUF2339)
MLMLLTGLVFLGNHAYRFWIPHFGPWGKLLALAASGSVLSIIGVRMHGGGAGRESLKNYSLVLLAGGLATLYYTAYGAHFVPSLKVIESPVAGGVLLLGMAGLIVRMAEKWKSETVALLAVMLSFYTSAMNPVAEFSLFSNLLLGGAAVLFLARHDWARLTWLSMIGSYAAFGFWRVIQGGAVVWGTGLAASEFWSSRGFLLTYWILFTLAFFIGGGRKLPVGQRAAGIMGNNAAFFAFSGPSLAQLYPGAFWLLPMTLGVVLILLSQLSRRREEDPLIESSLIAQGSALLMLGIASRLTGYSLALCGAVQAAVLLWLSGKDTRQALVHRLFSAAGVILASALCWDLLAKGEGLWISGLVAGVFLGMVWLQRRIMGTPAGQADPGAIALTGLAFILTIAVLRMGSWSQWGQWSPALAYPVLAALACLGWRKWRMPEAVGLAHALVFAGAFPFQQTPGSMVIPGVGFIALSWLWQRGKFGSDNSGKFEWATAAAGSVLLMLALWLKFPDKAWIAAGTCAALGWAAAGWLLKSRAVAVWSQVALGLALMAWFPHFLRDTPPGAWLLLGAMAASGLGAHVALARDMVAADWQWPVRVWGGVWRTLTALGLVRLLCDSGTEAAPLLLALQGVGWLVAGRRFAWLECRVTGGFIAVAWFLATCVIALVKPELGSATLSGLLLLAVLHVLITKLPDWLPGNRWRHALATGAVLVIAVDLTGWTQQHFGAGGYTAAWSLLGSACFGLGLAMRDSAVRRTGLALIAAALARILLVDVWALSTLGRVVSFLALGGVLLAVGFIYNRFSDRIQRWL